MRLIDADTLIEKFGDLTVELWLDSVEEAEIISLIGNAPTIEAPTWIPCSERLPSKDGQYLVWAVIGIVPDHVDEPSTYQGIAIASYYGDAWLSNVEKVLAWLPLPEPWKGAE